MTELSAHPSTEAEPPHEPTARTRRRVHDWGGDQLFTGHAPRRRFERGGRGQGTADPSAAVAAGKPRPEGAAAPDVHFARAQDERLAFVATAPDVRSTRGEDERPAFVVRISGRPHEPLAPGAALPPRARRRREPRRAHERLGPRPDRVAAWAVGLGALLVLLAVTTADAAAAVLPPL